MAAMNRAPRTDLRPPPMKLLPRHWPDWRVQGARPARAATLAAIERAEFRQLGDQRAGDDGPDAGNGGEQILLLAPRPASHAHDRRSRCRARPAPSPCALRSRAMLFCKRLSVRRRSRWPSAAIISTICRRRATRSASSRVVWSSGNGTRLRLGGFDKVSNHGSVDRIGLGPLAERLSEGPHLRRIDHYDRQRRRRQAGGNDCLEAAGGLDARSTRGASVCKRSPSVRSMPAPLRATTKLSPHGRTRTSSRSLATSIPTTMASI